MVELTWEARIARTESLGGRHTYLRTFATIQGTLLPRHLRAEFTDLSGWPNSNQTWWVEDIENWPYADTSRRTGRWT